MIGQLVALPNRLPNNTVSTAQLNSTSPCHSPLCAIDTRADLKALRLVAQRGERGRHKEINVHVLVRNLRPGTGMDVDEHNLRHCRCGLPPHVSRRREIKPA
eukprot:scaffold13136_cov63-Phaeocystis_antarctica.AAC.2